MDAAIRGGGGNWPELHAEKLADMELVPVCSPAFMAENDLRDVKDLARVKLLHSMARPDDWRKWLDSAQAGFEPRNRLLSEHSSLAYEGARMGLGVAVANRHFVQGQIKGGLLVIPFDHGCRTGESYYLTWPRERTPSQPLLKFLDWILAQIAADTAAAEAAAQGKTALDVVVPDQPE